MQCFSTGGLRPESGPRGHFGKCWKFTLQGTQFNHFHRLLAGRDGKMCWHLYFLRGDKFDFCGNWISAAASLFLRKINACPETPPVQNHCSNWSRGNSTVSWWEFCQRCSSLCVATLLSRLHLFVSSTLMCLAGGVPHTAVQRADGPEHAWQHQVHYRQVSSTSALHLFPRFRRRFECDMQIGAGRLLNIDVLSCNLAQKGSAGDFCFQLQQSQMFYFRHSQSDFERFKSATVAQERRHSLFLLNAWAIGTVSAAVFQHRLEFNSKHTICKMLVWLLQASPPTAASSFEFISFEVLMQPEPSGGVNNASSFQATIEPRGALSSLCRWATKGPIISLKNARRPQRGFAKTRRSCLCSCGSRRLLLRQDVNICSFSDLHVLEQFSAIHPTVVLHVLQYRYRYTAVQRFSGRFGHLCAELCYNQSFELMIFGVMRWWREHQNVVWLWHGLVWLYYKVKYLLFILAF